MPIDFQHVFIEYDLRIVMLVKSRMSHKYNWHMFAEMPYFIFVRSDYWQVVYAEDPDHDVWPV